MEGVCGGRGEDRKTGLWSGSEGPPPAGGCERGPSLGDRATFSSKDGDSGVDLRRYISWCLWCRESGKDTESPEEGSNQAPVTLSRLSGKGMPGGSGVTRKAGRDRGPGGFLMDVNPSVSCNWKG